MARRRAPIRHRGSRFAPPPQQPAPPPAFIAGRHPGQAPPARRGHFFLVPVTQAQPFRENLWRLGTPTNGWQFGPPVVS